LTKPGFAQGEPGIFYPTSKRAFFRLVPTDEKPGPAATKIGCAAAINEDAFARAG
jgi:hypothetical protein